MNKSRSFSHSIATWAGILVFLFAVNANSATLHIVKFGGSLGLIYSPASFAATVGDTVEWQGDFSIHPLSSTIIPTNAVSWHMGSGTVFSYVIKVPGTYSYKCDVHGGLGMIGAFTVSESTVNYLPNESKSLSRANKILAFDTRTNPSVTIYTAQRNFVRLEIFDLIGHRLATPVANVLDQGTHTILLGGYILASGHYFVKISGDGAETVRQSWLSGAK